MLNIQHFFSHYSYLFHYICEDRVIYLCITDDVSSLHALVMVYIEHNYGNAIW